MDRDRRLPHNRQAATPIERFNSRTDAAALKYELTVAIPAPTRSRGPAARRCAGRTAPSSFEYQCQQCELRARAHGRPAGKVDRSTLIVP